MSTSSIPTATPVAIPSIPDAQAIINAMERLGSAAVVPIDAAGNTVAILPNGKVLQSLKALRAEYAERPDRVTGTATMQDESSFIAHVDKFSGISSAIFCEPSFEKPSFTAVYDYHDVDHAGTRVPAFAVHRAVWPLRLSKEWTTWMGHAGKTMSHVDFAEFLERNVPDVFWGDELSEHSKLLISTLDLRRGTPSNLVALSRNLAVNVEVAVRSAQTLSSGEIALTYVENHKDGEGEPIKIPNAFFIAIPVVLGGPTYQVLARLRYRVNGGKITFAYDLHRVDIVFDAAVREIRERVAEATSCPVYLGAPEK